MADETSAELQDWIDRLGRAEEGARLELLERARHHLQKIATTIFQEDFPALRGRHDLDSVVNEVWMRLAGALKVTQPRTVDGLSGLVFHEARQVLLEIASRQRRDDRHCHAGPRQADESGVPTDLDRADTTHEPEHLALLTEFHEQIETLPADQRTVFELHYYGGFSHAEIAQMLELPRKQISRLWLASTGRLARWLDGFEGTP